MTRSRRLLVLGGLVACAWVVAAGYLFAAYPPWGAALATLVPLIAAGYLIASRYAAIPRSQLEAVARLASDIDRRRVDAAERFDDDSAHVPAELLPVVQALNRLLDYHEQRSILERDFTADASHELRTPLTGIRLQTEIALRTRDSDQRDQALNNILKGVDRGTRLVEQLLALSRLSAEGVDFERDTFDLSEAVLAEHEVLSELAASRDVNLEHVQSAPAPLRANRDGIGIMVNNLLRNAILHSPSGAHVESRIDCVDDAVRLLIIDDGPGIPASERALVMQRFRKSSRGAKVGTGLGLAIVERCLRQHGGTITLESPHAGPGLQAVVIIPAGLAARHS